MIRIQIVGDEFSLSGWIGDMYIHVDGDVDNDDDDDDGEK